MEDVHYFRDDTAFTILKKARRNQFMQSEYVFNCRCPVRRMIAYRARWRNTGRDVWASLVGLYYQRPSRRAIDSVNFINHIERVNLIGTTPSIIAAIWYMV